MMTWRALEASTVILSLAAACSGAQTVAQDKGPSLIVTRAILPQIKPEQPGYGAYSYILLTHDPRSDARGAALLAAYAGLPQDDASPNTDPATLRRRNVTYVPVVGTFAPNPQPTADWLKENYDLLRSVTLLQTQQLTDTGPYIVTYLHPLSMATTRLDVAVLDLSLTPAASMQPWLNYFVKAAARPDAWTSSGQVLLKLHDILAFAGHGASTTIEGIEPAGKIMRAVGF